MGNHHLILNAFEFFGAVARWLMLEERITRLERAHGAVKEQLAESDSARAGETAGLRGINFAMRH
jgi:hypothetical protein